VGTDRSNECYRDIAETFEAVAKNLDRMIDLNQADGGDPEVAARLKKAKARALQGFSKLRENLGQPPDEQSQRFG